MGKPAAYAPVFAEQTLEFFVGLTKRRQRKLLNHISAISRDPFLSPDFTSTDALGRPINHLIADEFIMDYWLDHAVKQIVFTTIDFAD